jgi:hypothetical protein
MFYKFLKFLFLSTLTLVWGCSEDKDHAVATYGCFSSKCYNTTAQNKSGQVFNIIECETGEKFLRNPGLYNEDPARQKELPEGVEVNAPQAGFNGCGATNCKYDSVKVCIDGIAVDENGNEHEIGACHPTIDCPEKK